MKRRLIDVNAAGRDADGNEFGWAAKPEMIAMGYMVNHPVRLRFPDGLELDSVQCLVTPKGLVFFAREMGVKPH